MQHTLDNFKAHARAIQIAKLLFRKTENGWGMKGAERTICSTNFRSELTEEAAATAIFVLRADFLPLSAKK